MWYYAPELVRQVPFLAVVDEWALGVIMHVLLSGDFPFDAPDEDDLEDLILTGDLSHVTKAPTQDSPSSDTDDGSSASSGGGNQQSSEVWLNVSSEAKDVLLGLLQPAMKKRLTAAQALEHPWFAVDGSRSFIGSHIWGAASSLNHHHGNHNGNNNSSNGSEESNNMDNNNNKGGGSVGAAAGASGATAATLWHVHARLDRLSSTARLPRRTYPAHAFLVDTLDYTPTVSSSSEAPAGSPAPEASAAGTGTGAAPTTPETTPAARGPAEAFKADELPPPGAMRRSLSSNSFASVAALQAPPTPLVATGGVEYTAATITSPIRSAFAPAAAAAAVTPHLPPPAVMTTPVVEVLPTQPEASPSQQAPLVFVVEEGVCEVVRVLEEVTVPEKGAHDKRAASSSSSSCASSNDSSTGNSRNSTHARYRFEHVGFRRKGSFVSADPRSYLPSQDELMQLNSGGSRGSSIGGSRFAVRAATAVTVSVLEAADMQ